MPRLNGTGPFGFGPMTGRGRGFCQKRWGGRRGAGFGWRRAGFFSAKDQISLLEEEEQGLREELEMLRKEKEALQKELDKNEE